eukprot:TRINITY_DN2062_c0_g1_i10.p1 TRINITY_DN2062_c0_g1~~TRINITY_DN2062_c0_g1_i10.p1  ORF type:complete len:103 (+),score=31.66 TRINITY_DN2062_c0_g1_i10:146-454(+)
MSEKTDTFQAYGGKSKKTPPPNLEERLNKAPQNTTYELKQQEIPYIYLTPLLAAPILGLIRLGFKGRPKLRNWAFGVTITFFLFHSAFLINQASQKKNLKKN